MSEPTEDLVERVARTIGDVPHKTLTSTDDVREYNRIRARAIIEEVADAVKEGFNARGTAPPYQLAHDDIVYWLRQQAREDG